VSMRSLSVFTDRRLTQHLWGEKMVGGQLLMRTVSVGDVVIVVSQKRQHVETKSKAKLEGEGG
jgi:hypothetical protein